jgi:hypothetical protein
MSAVVLLAWSVTALAGLYLLAIWLIEYDPDFQHAAATRLPVIVVCGHVFFAVVGLLSWVIYLITDKKLFCWSSAGALVLIATLGFTMAIRWIGVYRSAPRPAAVRQPASVGPSPAGGWPLAQPSLAQQGTSALQGSYSDQSRPGELAVPPERHFPVSVVIAHGIFAVTTVVLVVLIVFGVAGS